MSNKYYEQDTKRLDEECLKCKKYLEPCNGRTTGKAIPCLCFDEKLKESDE